MKAAASIVACSALLVGLAACSCQKEDAPQAVTAPPAAARAPMPPRPATSGAVSVASLPRETLPAPLDHLTLGVPLGGTLAPGPSGGQITLEGPDYALTIVDASRGAVAKLKELMLTQGAKLTVDDPDGFVAQVQRGDEPAAWTVLRFVEVAGAWHKCGTPRAHPPSTGAAAEEAFEVCGTLAPVAPPP